MDAQKFLGNLANLSDMVERAPHILYAKCQMVDGVPHIAFAFNTEPRTLTVHFDNEASCVLWWNEFVRMMTQMCTPPCIARGEILFQPTYLLEIACYKDTRAHFVILNFGNDRTLWLGLIQKEKQIALYADLLQALGDKVEDNPSPPYWERK